MSVSIYYTVRRDRPMTDAERQLIREAIDRHSVEDQIRERARTGAGPNWESFCIYDSTVPTEPDVIFEGATKLPDNSEEAC
jgi:hypothetical protein